MYDKARPIGKWQRLATESALPIFPIRVYKDAAGKWQKVPLTEHGHLDASFDANRFCWDGANGFGVRMGEVASRIGWYCLDVDDASPDGPPAGWLARWRVPMRTRQVATISGGLHLIYMLPGAHVRLPSRANIVPGLDARGEGGWIAFAEGYGLVRDLAPAVLPEAVCAELQAGWKGGEGAGLGGEVKLSYAPPDGAGVEEKLTRKLKVANEGLLKRWRLGRKPGGDQSASGLDMSVARLFADMGMTQDEITWVLTNRFEHGVVHRDGLNNRTLRAAIRCAAKAVAASAAERAARNTGESTISDRAVSGARAAFK